MDKTNIVNTFTEVLDQLRNTECSQKEKIACFQRISECIISPVMAAHLNYATYCSKAVNILLLFCEDLDSVVRISAEENLNKIFRVLEKTKVSRILMDLYGEIKRNGNQRSLRICLRIFGYYAPQIREHNILWYAQNLLQCLKVISKRKETLLQETLSEFVLKFGKHIQQGLTDSETCKLFEVFFENIGSDCAVKRRCTAQNCIHLIEHACNKPLMAKYALTKVIDFLLCDHETNTVIGVLGFLRQLVVIIIKGYSWNANENEDTFSSHKTPNTSNMDEARQVLEIYDYCLHLLAKTPSNQHSLINASLEVINSILQSLDGFTSRDKKNNPHVAPLLLELMSDKNLKHVNYLKHKGTIKQQIFNLQSSDARKNDVEGEQADAGYKLKPYLMTPFRNPNRPEEIIYNKKHASARNVVERCFGVLKNRFRSIIGSRGLHYSPKKTTEIINACCALHNMCLVYNCPVPTIEVEEETSSEVLDVMEEEMDAKAIRRNIAINLADV